MTIFLIVILILAFCHFIYEGVFLPSIRLSLRFRLFELRDEVRFLKFKYSDEFSDDAFDYLHQTLNAAIHILPRIDIRTVRLGVLTVRKDPDLLKEIQKRSRVLDECQVKELKNLQSETANVAVKILLANHGAWFIYLVPVVFVIYILDKLKAWILQLSYLPENKLQQMMRINPLAWN